MARLYIIGNGYDMARRGDTGYTDFRKWLLKEYGTFYHNGQVDYSALNNMIEYGTTLFSIILDDIVNETEQIQKGQKALAAAILMKCIEMEGDDWNKFEEYLGKLPVLKFAREWEKYNQQHGLTNRSIFPEPVSPEVSKTTSISWAVQELFKEWIANLGENGKMVRKGKFETNLVKEIKENDIFLIFNYLPTIENLFNNYDDAIFYHIHGRAGSNNIIVGHGENVQKNSLNTPEDYQDALKESLKKDTKRIILNNSDLWGRIKANSQSSDQFEIIEYGFSASQPDLPYVKKIIESIQSDDVVLRINNYKGCGVNKEKAWKDNGYKGKIDFYTE